MKLNHPEAGTPAVDQIVNATGNLVRVSRLTVAELTSGFAIKVRTQSINREDAELFLHQLRKDSLDWKVGGLLYRGSGVYYGRGSGRALRLRLTSSRP